jgi:hypothetical protein
MSSGGKGGKRIGAAKIGRTSHGYFHDLDPYEEHGTKKEATDDRSALRKDSASKSRKPRVQTFYTFLQDPRKGTPTEGYGSVPQGPHTFPHHAIHHALARAKSLGQLSDFDPLIPSPAQFKAAVDAEIPSGHPKEARAGVARSYYEKRHKRLMAYKTMPYTRQTGIKMAHTYNKLLQMHPYGSYAYKGGGASKKALKHKGERAGVPLDQQVDMPKSGTFTDMAAAKKRIAAVTTVVSAFHV